MRFTITALGSAGGRSVGQVVGDIVRYLEPRTPASKSTDRPATAVPGGDGPSSYYSDRGTEPGRWLGVGAAEADLVGDVDPNDFARVLAGRDPRTGRRLLAATGSAGRRPTLGVGQHAAERSDGELLYTPADAAAVLGLEQRDLDALIRAGERHVISHLLHLAGGQAPADRPAGSYLTPIIDDDGERWISGTELDRCETARALGTTSAEVVAMGQPDDQLTTAEAARLAGVIPRYVRRLCRRWETDRSEIEAAIEAGLTERRDYIVGHRGTRGQWLVTRAELAAFLERRRAPAVRVGFDLTLTTEKSLGVLALLGDDATRRSVLDAIQSGNDVGLAHLEYHAAAGRSKGKPILGRGLTIASFRHLTSRALDPFPHHHNVIANSLIDENGSRRALDARHLYDHAQSASALATLEMRHRLTTQLGVRWRRGRSGSWEIDGIDDTVLREFSRRRNEIEDAVAELEAEIGRRTSLDEVQEIITNTRAPKEEVDPADLAAGWWQRALSHGLTPDRLADCLGRERTPDLPDDETLYRRLAHPIDGVCANHSIFTRSEVLTLLADLEHDGQPLPLAPADAERLADSFLASDHVVQLDNTNLTGALARVELFTTTEILDVQRRITRGFEQGRSQGFGLVSEPALSTVMADASVLSDEQRSLVTAFCTSGHQVQCGIGRAGAGKTTAMSTAAAAWTAAGHRVVGAAVKGEAARHLANGADIPTETIAWYLARADQAHLLDERTVLVIDEASTIADRDLDAIVDLARRSGATVRLIGDPDQHGAVAAGGMFRHLCRVHPGDTPELSTTHRVQHEADRAAARLLLDGKPEEALAALEHAGHLHIADDDTDLYIGMLRSWWSAHRNGELHPMVDRRHQTRRVLNRLARQLRRANGELGQEVTVADGRAFAVGDRVVARMVARDLHVDGDRNAYLRNGASGVVVAVSDADSEIDVAFDGIGTITLPLSFVAEHEGPGGRTDVGLDHAYAVTSYAVQGATFERSTSRIDEGASRAETYVDITRGRLANQLFLTRAPDPLDGEHLPKAPDPEVTRTVTDRLRRSGPELVAICRGVSTENLRVGRALAHRPPRAWTSRSPVSADDAVHLQVHAHSALQSLLAFRATHRPTAASTHPWAWALGTNTDQRLLTPVLETLETYALAVVEDRTTGLDIAPEQLAQLADAMRSGVSAVQFEALVEQLWRPSDAEAQLHRLRTHPQSLDGGRSL